MNARNTERDDTEAERLRRIAEAQPAFSNLMGMRITSISRERIEAEMIVRDEFANRNGVLHGGAIMAFADPGIRRDLKAVVSFGGYADVRRMVNSLFTGQHEWDGRTEHVDPDPYGRWIMAGNYLTRIPEFAGMVAVQRGAHALAMEAGRRGDWSWDPVYDPMKADIRRTLSPAEQKVWDVLAPATDAAPADPALVRHIADAFVTALLETDPGLDPRPRLADLRGRVVLSHGRADRLIPYTETLRLQSLMPPAADTSVAITGLFAHSSHAGWMHPMDRVREAAVFIRLLNQALAAV